jgi:malonyl-CoA O-methyltransferase
MSEEIGVYALERNRVRRSFDRAAASYDAAAVLDAEVRYSLLERLELTALQPRTVLDAGAGTGQGSRALKRRYPRAVVIALDSSQSMLRAAARQQRWLRPFARICADAEHLPLKSGSIDLIVSNLMLHWCDPDAVFAEFRRVLAPRGLLTFSAFGPDTLRELRAAWAQVDPHTHVHQFIDMHDLGDALVRSGFASPVLDVDRITLQYLDVRAVAADLKATGAGNAARDRPKGLTTPRKFAKLVFAHAWVPAESRPRGTAQRSVPLDDLKRQLRARREK